MTIQYGYDPTDRLGASWEAQLALSCFRPTLLM